MTDLVASVFQLRNANGLFAPKVDFGYAPKPHHASMGG